MTSAGAAAFQVASVVSTTGFMTDDYLAWRPAAQVVIFLLFFVGALAGRLEIYTLLILLGRVCFLRRRTWGAT